MLWTDTIRPSINSADVINDSKTPSGRVHVGSLRGVLIHDAIFRSLRKRGANARYIYGVDDFDPLDALPLDNQEYYQEYLGVPLCNVPPPPDSKAADFAEHYIQEFFQIFSELGVGAETYRMREIYRSGRFNKEIHAILSSADVVRRIYFEVSGARRPKNWYPFQILCECCGKIATTQVTGYDSGEVEYQCCPDVVGWATGCGHKGRTSPFDGRGKLPWKLEWAAKWNSFGITIEGAGKDHCVRGGSRDVAVACLKAIFGRTPPLNVPYEFFLSEGAKMSSSKGLGHAGRDIADLLQPEILRYMMIRTLPRRAINFSVTSQQLVKLHNNFDSFLDQMHKPTVEDQDTVALYWMCQVSPESPIVRCPESFQFLGTVVQLPHIDVRTAVKERRGRSLTAEEMACLARRETTVRIWLENYAREDEKFVLQQKLPARVRDLSHSERAFLTLLADHLESIEWSEEAIQGCVFTVARLIPIVPKEAFRSLYRAFLDRDSGPRAGSFLSVLERDFVLERLCTI